MVSMTGSSVRVWRPDWPCPAGRILSPLRHGPRDPTYSISADGDLWRAFRTPTGPATLRISTDPTVGEITGEAWGVGSEWVLDQFPRMLGADDDVSGFVPLHAVITEAWRRHANWRLGASGLVMDSLVPAIIEQKVTGQEALSAYRQLVHRFGEPAPGPKTLLLQPDAATLRQIPSWEWLRLPIDGGRSRPILAASGVASSLERAGRQPAAEFDRRLRSVPGIGVWTSAEVRSRALGDADAVSFGDFHIAKDVGWALTGEAVDDAGLAVLLEPYRGHRHRVQRLVELAGLHRPRRGPRMAPRSHLPRTRF